MPRLPAQMMPWISVLFAWAILAYATHAVLHGAHANPTLASVSMATYRSASEAVAGGRSSEDDGRARSSMFGSYDWWLFSPDRQSLCGLATRCVAAWALSAPVSCWWRVGR